METNNDDISFIERRRVPFRALIGAIAFAIITVQGFRLGSEGLGYIMLVCTLWYFGMAFFNRNAGSKVLMTLKDDGILFFNADGIVPYTSIEGLEVEAYNSVLHLQFSTVLHINSKDAGTLPKFNDSRFKIFFKMPSARKGKGFRKHLVVFNYGGLKTLDGELVNATDLEEEIIYRIEKSIQKTNETEQG